MYLRVPIYFHTYICAYIYIYIYIYTFRYIQMMCILISDLPSALTCVPFF